MDCQGDDHIVNGIRVRIGKVFRKVNSISFTHVKAKGPQNTLADECVNAYLKVFCISSMDCVRRSIFLYHPHAEQ